MRSALVLLLWTVAAATAQQTNAPAVNWLTVQPLHSFASFFDRYPLLRSVFERQSPLTSNLEGSAATRSQFPHQVALVLNPSAPNQQLHFCGGSLISNQWILTAAHCLTDVINGTAILGVHRIRNAAEAGQLRITVSQFFAHPGWNGLRLTDDVGLVRLPLAVQFTANVAPIRLSNYRQIPSAYALQQATLNGFGRSIYAPANFDISVRYALFRVLPAINCASRVAELQLDSSQFCAEPLSGRQCPSDSGGALTIVEADGSPTQIGVVSFVTGLGCSTRPAIFTRLNFYLRWIEQTTGIPIANDFTF